MNVAKMRFVDRWLGTPVCWLLTVWRRLFGRRTPAPADRPRRILFVKLAEQGSTVLAQGALQAAVDRVGRENVYFLLFSENRPILDLLDILPPENVIGIDAHGLGGTVRSAVAAIWRLRRLRLDAALDLEFFARASAALCYLSGARWRVGYHAFGGEASYRGDLMTHRLSFNPYLHTSQAFEVMVQALDQPAELLPSFHHRPTPLRPAPRRFLPGALEVAQMRRLLQEEFGAGPAPLILLNANASDLIPLRRWSAERYVELARRLLARYPELHVAFTGAPGEAAAAQRLASEVGYDRCVALAGKTTLRQLLVLCSLAEVLVSNDSGPAHFATLTDVDVVVLFGPETPQLFAAVSPRTQVLWAGLACSPCINAFNDRASPCTNNQCMQALTVEQVFRAVCQRYEGRWRKTVAA